ncbi:MAG: M23 family metallopeptidase [Pseudoflavonifractor sp.]
MEQMYRENRGWQGRHRAGRRGKRPVLGLREARRLAQLAVCMAVFFVIFLGSGIFPGQMQTVRRRLSAVIGGDTDFRGAFSTLGASVSRGEPALEALGQLWVELSGEEVPAPPAQMLHATPTYLAQKQLLTRPVTAKEMLSRSPGLHPLPKPQELPVVAPPPAEPAPAVVHVDYSGPALPANATMDRYPLELAGTLSPVVAPISSGFGWREHPLDGQEKFHNGVDLVVNEGSPVLAFADGVVDYVGESPIYGLYMQLKHANGVTTFYAHNSKLCRQQGETVAMGEKITESGQTGNVTGAHLHFEVKKDGLLLNPSYYIKTQ